MTRQVLVIAEAGVNHNGSLAIAHQMIDTARECAADVVKFQLFEADRLVTAAARQADYQVRNTGRDEGQRAMLRRLELSRSAHVELARHAADLGIEFLSTPFDEDALAFLVEEVGVKRLKLSSGDLTNGVLVSHAALTGLPVILSTGMATLAEVSEAVDLFAFVATEGVLPEHRSNYQGFSVDAGATTSWRDRLTLLQCTSEYPTPSGSENVLAMTTLGAKWGCHVGYSDHTLGNVAAVCAVALGASVVEKHFTLDPKMSGPDHAASMSPEGLTCFVNAVREAQHALGTGLKVPTPSEVETAERVRKVVVARSPIQPGEELSLTNLTAKRAGAGMEPSFIWGLQGKFASRSYAIDEAIIEVDDSCDL